MQDFDGAAVMQCLLPPVGSVSIMRGSVVEFCILRPQVTIGSDCIVSSSVVSGDVPRGTFVHTIAVRPHGQVPLYVTHVFDLFKDDLKAKSLNEMTFCGVMMPLARDRLGLSFLDVWPTAGMQPTMWSAQLFPLAETPQASFEASMEVYHAVTGCRPLNLHNTVRMSLQQSFDMKDINRDREQHDMLRRAIN